MILTCGIFLVASLIVLLPKWLNRKTLQICYLLSKRQSSEFNGFRACSFYQLIFPRFSGVVQCAGRLLKKGEDHAKTTTDLYRRVEAGSSSLGAQQWKSASATCTSAGSIRQCPLFVVSRSSGAWPGGVCRERVSEPIGRGKPPAQTRMGAGATGACYLTKTRSIFSRTQM
jgi:hypothetical protein